MFLAWAPWPLHSDNTGTLLWPFIRIHQPHIPRVSSTGKHFNPSTVRWSFFFSFLELPVRGYIYLMEHEEKKHLI